MGIWRNCAEEAEEEAEEGNNDEDLFLLHLPVFSSSVETARMGVSRWSQCGGLEELSWRRCEDDN